MKIPVNFQHGVIFILVLFLAILVGFKVEEPGAQQQPKEKEQPVAEAPSPEPPGSKAMMEEVSCETCHGTLEEVAANTTQIYPEGVKTESAKAALVTQVFPINPHKSHYGEMKCTQCHKERGETTLYCNTCHDFSRVQFSNTMVSVSDKSCLKCHESYEKMASVMTKRFPSHVKTEIQKASMTTQIYPTNPHKTHYGDMKCTQCHKIHGESKLYCNTCHSFKGVDVP